MQFLNVKRLLLELRGVNVQLNVLAQTL